MPNLEVYSPEYQQRIEVRREKTAKNKVKRMQDRITAARLQVTLADIEHALRLHRGILARAAEDLSCTRSVLARKIEMTPSLGRVVKEIEQENIDRAEEKLLKLVEQENVTAVTFALRTKGKDRGYTEKATLEHELGAGTIKTAADVIKALREGASFAKELEAPLEVEWVEVPASNPDQTS